MPIYEYQCGSCGHQLEAFQNLSDAPLTDCPKCHDASLTKLVSAAGFQLKGTGWYKTDYSSKHKKSEEKETQSTPPKSDKKTEDKPKETAPDKTPKGSTTSSSGTESS